LTTFEEPRAIVATNRGPGYPPEADFVVAPYGWENDVLYVVVAGSYAEVYGPRNPEDFNFISTADGPLRGQAGLPSSSQCAATFLLGCTRGGSPGIFGMRTTPWPCSPATMQVATLCHAQSYRARTRP
jgi:hypothetical protein